MRSQSGKGPRDTERTTLRRGAVQDDDTDVESALPVVDPLATTSAWQKERYQVRSVLGRGGMGEVQLCHDDRIGRDIAKKQLLPELSSDAELVARFLREARVQGQLEHPAIVPVHDVGTTKDGETFFTMKRVRGTTLQDILDALASGDADARARFTRRRLLSAMVTVCLAVDFAHKRGVVHRDLKPGNIMLGDFGEVYVLDWGLARVRGDAAGEADGATLDDAPTAVTGPTGLPSRRTQVGDILGTPGFMSPEQARGDDVDARSDVYALGAILFEILALEPLHLGSSYGEIAQSTAAGADARPSMRNPAETVSPELDAICVHATALDPTRRLGSARAISDAIEGYLEGDRDTARRRELATRHALAAQSALAATTETPDEEARARRFALREATTAVALDPNLEAARSSLVQTLTEPFEHPPREALAAYQTEESERAREIVKMGTWAWAGLVAYLPVLLWMGVTRPLPIVAIFLAFATNAAVYHWTARRSVIDERTVTIVLLVNSAAIGVTTFACGPFLLTPALAAVNVIPFLLFVRRARVQAVTLTAAPIAIGFIFERLGWLPVRYTYEGGAMVVRSTALAFPELPTSVLLFVGSLGTIIIAAIVVSRVKDRLARVEQQLHVYGWQLSQLLPPKTGARTTRRIV